MRWKIQIDGDKQYLEELNYLLSFLNFDPKICKEGEEYFLEGSIFENPRDANEISDIAKTLLTFMFHMLHFKTGRNVEAPRIKNIIETVVVEEGVRIRTYDPEVEGYSEKLITKDGKEHYTLNIQDMLHKQTAQSPNLYTSEDLTDFRKFDTLEKLSCLIENNKNNKELLKKLSKYLSSNLESLLKFVTTSNSLEDEKRKSALVSFLSDFDSLNSETNIETLKWVILYKVFEALGGKNNWKDRCDKDTLDKFTCTAQLRRHSENKKEYKNCENKINELGEIPLSEAEEFISTLISKYIDEKVKGGEP
jgi:predicted nucleic acid-binding protein